MGMRWITCDDCGTRVKINMHARRAKVCASCGIERATVAALQMAQRQGRAWDAYVASGQARGRLGAPRDDAGRFTAG